MGVNQIRHLLTEMRSLGQDIQGIFSCGKTKDKSWVELAQQSNPGRKQQHPFTLTSLLQRASAEADMAHTTRQHGFVPQSCKFSRKMCSKYLSISSGEVLWPSLVSTLVKVLWKSWSRNSLLVQPGDLRGWWIHKTPSMKYGLSGQGYHFRMQSTMTLEYR